jgi:hypothetical protein
MNDDIDALLMAKPLAAPPGFAARLTALAQATPQAARAIASLPAMAVGLSLAAAAGLGALRLCEFVFVAFVAAGAQ